MGESGGSAERMAQQLAARGDVTAAAWAAGADGERRVAAALATLPEDFLVLHDRLLMPGVTESNLDHLVVGPSGVYLVDAKNWAGNVTEYRGALIQHRRQSDGSWTHRSKHRELAAVHGMGREMAERLRVPVTPVLCLAGSRATRFGPPQMVRGIWVVPLPGLVAWVTSRPATEAVVDLARVKTLVTTEFPSTTTDPVLLAAMGRDLEQRARVSRRQRTVRRAAPTAPPNRPAVTTGPPPRPAHGPAAAPLSRRQRGDARRAAQRARRTRRLRRSTAGLLLAAGVYAATSGGLVAEWVIDRAAGLGQQVTEQTVPPGEVTSSTTAPTG